METTDPFHGNELSRPDRAGGLLDGPMSSGVREHQPRAADRTGVGLGVKAPVGGILVLCPAPAAHFKVAHGGIDAIVGDRVDDAESRPAGGAVGKRISITTVAGIEDLPEALRAGSEVGEDFPAARVAVFPGLEDLEGQAALGGALDGSDRSHDGAGRRLVAQAVEEAAGIGGGALDLDFHAGRGIAYPAGQLEVAGQSIDEGAEADALHRAGHLETETNRGFTLRLQCS